VLKAGKAKSHTNDGEAADDESNELELQPVSSNVEDLEANGIAVTLNLEQRNFSMPEGRLVTPPPPPDESALSPYVPNNSFSYQLYPIPASLN